MTTLKVYTGGHSPKKFPVWMLVVVGFLALIILGNAIYMASSAQDTAEKETAEGGESSGDATTAELALARAKEKVQAVLDKQQELAGATDEVTKTLLERELTDLMKELTSAEMREAIRENSEVITLELAKMLRDGILEQEEAANHAHQQGDADQELEHALNAQELKIALEAIRGSLDSSVHSLEASEVDSIVAEALASAQRLADRLMSFYK